MSTFTDRDLTCTDCKATFVFTAGEQEFFQEKGFSNDPKRCPDCRKKNKEAREKRGGKKPNVEVTCDGCGKQTTVPFQPTGTKPVYCRACFDARK